MKWVHFVLPNDIDDPAAPSGGNVYDRRLCQGLAALGWTVREHPVPGGWPRPTVAERAVLAGVLAGLPDDAVVLVDGLVASSAPDELVAAARRLRLVVLVHMPLGDENPDLTCRGEGEALWASVAVVTTSAWTRRRLLERYALPPDRVHIATPGVDPAPLSPGSRTGSELLCVATVTRHKGHDVLTEALARIPDLPWSCVCIGSLSRDPAFVDQLRRRALAYGVADRIRFRGPCVGGDLAAAYAAADLLVLASRGETYGMVVTEALARGIPVVATATSGLPEALGRAPDNSLPGLLVEPDNPAVLAAAVRRWLTDADLRNQLRRAARARRDTLTGWTVTARRVSNVLRVVAGRRPVGAVEEVRVPGEPAESR